MKLAISNIAWRDRDDAYVLDKLPQHGVSALEIAPTRVIPEMPYRHLDQAKVFRDRLLETTGMGVCSMQSIWFKRTERIFGSQGERDILSAYTKEAILFAETVGCPNLVFGSPKNRIVPDGRSGDEALSFFREIGKFAALHGVVVALEAVPVSYGTNFLNQTSELYEYVKKADCPGLKMNLDFGTMITNGEDVRDVEKYIEYISHVHISENHLAALEIREEHNVLVQSLKRAGYGGYVSIEMGNQENPDKVLSIVDYVHGIIESIG